MTTVPDDGQAAATTQASPTSDTEAGTTATTPSEPTWDELPGIESLPQELQDELLELVRTTEELRGLRFLEAPIISVVSDEELESRVRQLIEEESEDLPADGALYKLLGLVDDEVDVAALLTNLYGEQVGGFYDGDTGELVVPIRDEGFSVFQRSVMVHELTHSLTDQQFGFYAASETMVDEDRLDEAAAYGALIEGDATMTQTLYLGSLAQDELDEFFAEVTDTDTVEFDAAPAFIQDSLTYPYESGLAWVEQQYQRDEWESVNAAYSAMPDLPGSTEQIITPDDYQRDLPRVVEVQPPSIPDYELTRESVWGEFGFRIMLDQVLGEDVGVEASDGWGGDYYAQWFDGENAALLIVVEGDTESDTEELLSALLDYARDAVSADDWVRVEEIDGRGAFIAADDAEVGESILASIGG